MTRSWAVGASAVKVAHFGRTGQTPHSSNARPCPSAAPTAGRRTLQASAAAAGSRLPAAIAAATRGPASRIANA